MKKFLIIQTAFIGDVILATPLIENLTLKFPDAVIDFMVKRGNETLLENHPTLRNILVFDKKKKVKAIVELTRQIRKEKYDAVFNLQRFASSGLLTFLSGAKKKYGFSKNPFSFSYHVSYKHEIGNGVHEVERNLKVISDICSPDFAKPKLYPSNTDLNFVSNFKNKPFVCLAPASVWYTKQAPKQKWVELIKRLSNLELNMYLIGGPGDKDLCEEIILESSVDSALNLAGKLSLMQSAALMKDAKMNFVNDSGPLHFASAMNAPITAFFCSTVPEFGFGPLSDKRQIIEVKDLDCKPCGLHGHKVCPKGHFKCGNLLDISNFNL